MLKKTFILGKLWHFFVTLHPTSQYPGNIMKRFRHILQTIIFIIPFVHTLLCCGNSHNQEKKHAAVQKQAKTLHIGTLPTIDCLPIFIMAEHQLIDTATAFVRLVPFLSQMDCDEAFRRGKINICASDVIRSEMMKRQGKRLKYITTTPARWLLVAHRTTRAKNISHLKDRMIGMTRHSATEMLTHHATDSAKLKNHQLFAIQINDVLLRLKMMNEKQIDAAWLPEPQATEAKQQGHIVLADSRASDSHLGVLIATGHLDPSQEKAFVNAYNKACDSINQLGVNHYTHLIKKYCKVSEKTIKKIPAVTFYHALQPDSQQIQQFKTFLKQRQP